MKTNEEYIQEWLEELEVACSKSHGTVKNYRSPLLQFSTFINKPFSEVDRKDIIDYFKNVGTQEIATKTRKQSTICNFYNWMYDNKYCERHPMMSRMTFGAETKILNFLEKKF